MSDISNYNVKYHLDSDVTNGHVVISARGTEYEAPLGNFTETVQDQVRALLEETGNSRLDFVKDENLGLEYFKKGGEPEHKKYEPGTIGYETHFIGGVAVNVEIPEEDYATALPNGDTLESLKYYKWEDFEDLENVLSGDLSDFAEAVDSLSEDGKGMDI